MLDNNEIVGDVEDTKMAKDVKYTGKAKNARNIGKAKDTKDRRNTQNVKKARNTEDRRDARDIKEKKARKSNNIVANRGDQKDNEIGNAKVGDSGNFKASKLEDVNVSNNGVNHSKNQDNQRATIKNVADFINGVIVIVDPINGVFVNVLAYFFGSLSPKSNLPPGITTACFG